MRMQASSFAELMSGQVLFRTGQSASLSNSEWHPRPLSLSTVCIGAQQQSIILSRRHYLQCGTRTRGSKFPACVHQCISILIGVGRTSSGKLVM